MGTMATCDQGFIKFVYVGAFDGEGDEFGNRLFEDLVKEDGWRGLFIEPQYEAYERLIDRYQGIDGLYFANVAIGKPGKRTMWRNKLQPFHHPNVQTNASFHKSSALILPVPGRFGGDLRTTEDPLEKIEVRSCSLKYILKKNNIKHFDVMIIDTEGDDFNILVEMSHLDSYPELVKFEHAHFDSKIKSEMYGLVENLGYRCLKEDYMDAVFCKNDSNRFSEYF